MTLTTLMSAVLPDGGNLAYAELYSDPPGLSPMAEEEPLIERVCGQAAQRVHHRPLLRPHRVGASSGFRRCRFSRGRRANHGWA